MKQFEVPSFYRSPLISKIKAARKIQDPRKKDFTPTEIHLGSFTFILARHFGFCYGVENAIERSYKALAENPGKRIFLLSQMIHNPAVNQDLTENGITFLQDTNGKQLIDFKSLTPEDIVLIPAFGTTVEIENELKSLGLDIQTYNTTCPFVEKVWNRSDKLGETQHTIIIHGKHAHEETRATFSHASASAPALILKDLQEAIYLGEFLKGKIEVTDFLAYFEGRLSDGFDPSIHLRKIGVVNQTTMLASETEAITQHLRDVMISVHGEADIKNHIADTRDTLCYATNDNQTATYGLLEQEADLAIVVGGYNSSNTSHLVELLEQKFKTFFIKDADEIGPDFSLQSFDIHSHMLVKHTAFIEQHKPQRIVLTSGASCPDSIVEAVMKRILTARYSAKEIEQLCAQFD
ncbi:MAG: 4-hydroxy-3-methylbut-2-enyl diphosphate reductase [Flavobacteriales bacterium]